MNCRNNAHLFAMLALLLAGLLLSGRSGAADQAPAAPGEILVGLRASDDRAEVAASLAQTIGPVAAHHVALHTYRMQLKSGLLLQNALAQLKARPEVLYAEPNYLVHSAATPNDTGYANQYGPQKVQADLAWCLWSPQQTVIIAIVDTGIDNTHPDLTNKILRDSSGNVLGYNALTGVAGPASDDNGHGTHCAGIAGAQTNNGTGIAGIAAWNGQSNASDTTHIKLMPVKVLDSTGSGAISAVANGITWAADHGARVISLSLGNSTYSSMLDSACQYAWNKGCVLVAAAGNSGSSELFYPAANANVISVAATDATDTLTSYSNYGSWVQVAAPGDMIYSTTPTYKAGANFPLNYAYLSGTSMATPHVAGEAALLLGQNPALSNSQVSNLIVTNVDTYTPDNGHLIAATGGRINIYKALQAAGGAPTVPLPPTNLTATAGSGQISLAWTGSAGAVSYNVKRSVTSGGPYVTLASGVTATAYTDTGVAAGTTYFYVVTAVNAAGESGNSNQASATAPVPVNPPTDLTATAAKQPGRIGLTWKQSTSSHIAQNNIYRATTSGGPYTLIATVSATSYTDMGLSNGVRYYYVVTAVNSSGQQSGNSNQASAVPK